MVSAMTPVEASARAVQQHRIASAIEEARDDVSEVALAKHIIAGGTASVRRHRDFFVAAAALIEDDLLWNALVVARMKVVRERDLDVSMALGKAVP